MTQETEMHEAQELDSAVAGLVDFVAKYSIDQEKWPAKLRELIDFSAAAIIRAGESPEQASKLAEVVVASISFMLGGRSMYLPSGNELKAFIRDYQIYREFTGHNHEALCRRYGLAKPTIYQIIQQHSQLQKMVKLRNTIPTWNPADKA